MFKSWIIDNMKTFIAVMMLTQLISCQPAWVRAEVIDIERLATSIRKAEGNDNYGILKHIKGKNFRKACKQTITHAIRDWDGRGSFIHFLSVRYAPINCSNDNGTNQFWESNVRRIYNAPSN